MAQKAVEPNPFLDPDFVLPAARGLGEWEDVGIIRILAGNEWIACLPVCRYSRWHKLPLPSVATWLHRYCLLGTPLVAPGYELEAMEALVATLRQVEGAALASLEWTSAEGSLADALKEASPANAIVFDRFSRPTLARKPNGDYLADVKGKHRREFKRLARGLEAELDGPLDLIDRTGEPEAIETFLELEASGWKGQQGTALASDPAHAEFLRETARSFEKRRALELLFLEVAGRPVAVRCSFLSSGVNFCFKVSYDERFRRFSPGRELELRLVDRFHVDESLNWMDSCANRDNELFSRLWPEQRELFTIALPASQPLGKLTRSTLRAAIALRERQRKRRRT
ncbi:MAG: GNAT family N-acetyltransferase [Solirubrobacterales bacterium]